MTERVFDLEARTAADPLRGREELKRFFKGGGLRLDPQPDGVFVARGEFLPLEVCLTQMANGRVGGSELGGIRKSFGGAHSALIHAGPTGLRSPTPTIGVRTIRGRVSVRTVARSLSSAVQPRRPRADTRDSEEALVSLRSAAPHGWL